MSVRLSSNGKFASSVVIPIRPCRLQKRQFAPDATPLVAAIATSGPQLCTSRVNQRGSTAVVQSAAAGTPALPEEENGIKQFLVLTALMASWYGFTIIFNVYNKQLLKLWFFPLTSTAYQFGIGGLIGAGWFAITGHRFKLSTKIIKSVLPLAIVHILANTLTNLSLGLMAVSFTHTVKALEPFIATCLTMIFMGERPHPLVLLCLVPIIGGVIGASFTEATFNWIGFAAAIGSSLSLCFRNVLSKKFMTPEVKKELGGPIGLFSLITMMSFVLLSPIAMLTEGIQMTPAAMAALGVDLNTVMYLSTIAAVTFHSYQQTSYMVLSKVNPVTHSIGNCVKRVVVIVASVFIFKNTMSAQSMWCTSIALGGVFAYSQAKRITGNAAKAKLQ